MQAKIRALRPADYELAQSVAAGDPDAQRQLVERLLDRIRTSMHYITPAAADADDMTQLALMEIIRSTRHFRGESSLEQWADRSAVRTAMRYLNKQRRRRVVERSAYEPETVDGAQGLEELSMRRIGQRISLLLSAVPVKRRVVLVLRLVHGFGIDEIAEVLEISRNTVRDRLQVGRRELRKKLRRDPAIYEWLVDAGLEEGRP